MEITVEERLTGRQLRTQILEKYGTLGRLKAAAAKKGAYEAKDDLADMRLLEDDPKRLDQHFRIVTVTELAPEELSKLTIERMRLLHFIASSKTPPNVTRLAARLKRDKKNISEDLVVLEGLGLIRAKRKGREKEIRASGTEIRIVLAAASA